MITFVFLLVILSIPSFAEDNFDVTINSLSRIVVDKPIDNSYQLNLYFKDNFDGNAFLQKRKNGSFFVYIPDTVLSSKNIELIYKNKANKSDVRISVEEQPFIKESLKSKYVKLSVDTPVNSDIQLTAQVDIPEKSNETASVMNIYSIIVSILALIILVLFISIYRAMRSITQNSNSYTPVSNKFLNSQKEFIDNKINVYERPIKIDVDSKMISPISTSDFRCFNLPLKREEAPLPISSAINQNDNSLEERTVRAAATNPIKRQTIVNVEENKDEVNLDLPLAEEIIEAEPADDDDESFRPELLSELKIGNNKGFYLTTVGDNSFALFGYVNDKVFFLQKFMELKQSNIQTRFYEKRDNDDLYLLRLGPYKAMIAVNDSEIKELAVI